MFKVGTLNTHLLTLKVQGWNPKYSLINLEGKFYSLSHLTQKKKHVKTVISP